MMAARSLSADVLFTEPHGSLLPGLVDTYNFQYVGIAFTLNQGAQIQDVTVQMGNDGYPDTFFAALCVLDPTTHLPHGNPFQSGDILYSELFTAPSSSIATFTIPFAVTVPAGQYGLIFGGNSFGANVRSGYSATYQAQPGISMTVWNPSGGWFYDGYSTLDVTIDGMVVPEPTPVFLLGLGCLAFILFRLKGGRPIGA